MKRPPILVLGMHRSGTTMLLRVLEALGVFVGYRLDENREAKFFTKLNDWALRQANASWDDPAKYRHLTAFQRQNILRVWRTSLRSLRRLEYLGPGKFLRYRGIEDLDLPWAFKDPRNTFTADLWREIFPTARIVHVHRHPLDVAQSLRQRELRQEKTWHRSGEIRLAEALLARRPLYGGSARVRDLRAGVGLWEEYMSRVSELKADLDLEIYDVSYEEFVAAPSAALQPLLAFLELEASPARCARAVAPVREGRAYAFMHSPELRALHRELRASPILRDWGYDPADTWDGP